MLKRPGLSVPLTHMSSSDLQHRVYRIVAEYVSVCQLQSTHSLSRCSPNPSLRNPLAPERGTYNLVSCERLPSSDGMVPLIAFTSLISLCVPTHRVRRALPVRVYESQ